MSDIWYQVIIVELDDVVPRRCSTLPNLWVGKTSEEPDVRFERLKMKRSKSWYSGHEVRLCDDLMDFVPYSSHEEADEAIRETTARLMSEGYTVNQNTTVWTVYVIELDINAMPKPGLGYIYVGETTKPHEERFLEHMSRKRNSKIRLFSPVVAKHGQRLLPEFARPGVLYDDESSKMAEAEWAEHWRSKGYVVEGGH